MKKNTYGNEFHVKYETILSAAWETMIKGKCVQYLTYQQYEF